MDDVTTLLQTSACTTWLLKRLEELLAWARMKIKSSNFHSLSIWKEARNDVILGKHMANSHITQLSKGPERIDKTHLPGKFKTWCS